MFIAFLDDIIDTLKEKCIAEPVINDLHCILHADDTLLLSTNSILDGILGTYLRIYIIAYTVCGSRFILTKYRAGLRYLKISTGRKNNEDRTERICMCGNNIQAIDHILFHCHLTKDIRTLINLEDYDIIFFRKRKLFPFLLRSTKDILHIE